VFGTNTCDRCRRRGWKGGLHDDDGEDEDDGEDLDALGILRGIGGKGTYTFDEKKVKKLVRRMKAPDRSNL
jgi:hypothetical protein